MRVLVVEDHPKMALAICQGLSEHGYTAEACHLGEEAEKKLEKNAYDMIILDAMLPDRDGFEICQSLRERNIATPILMLTALSGTQEKVAGLEAGADDYLTKPFEFEELIARIRALLRRGTSEKSAKLKCCDLELDLATRTATRDGKAIRLSSREMALLEHFMRNQGRVVTRQTLAQKVWGLHYEPESNVIDVYISALRRKIDRDAPTRLIHTVIGSGYRFGIDPHAQDSAQP